MQTTLVNWTLVPGSALLSLATAVFYRALRGASPARLEELNAEHGRYGALPDLDDALVATGWLKVVVYAGFAASVAFAFFSDRGGTFVSYLAASGLAAAALLACEALALVAVGFHSGRGFYHFIPLVAMMSGIGATVLAAGGVAAGVMAKISWREAPPGPEEAAQDEILDAATDARRQGAIEPHEREMIESIIEFKDVEVSRIMTPRTELVTVKAAASVASMLETATATGHSRIPVFAESADNVVGVLHVKDILRLLGSEEAARTPVRDVMRAPYFVPETKRVRELLQEFRATNLHMAIVLDEYGGTSGAVTIEDILEEIVGEIEDEYKTYASPAVRAVSPTRIVVDARATIRDVNEALALELPESPEYETIAGYVLFYMGRIPKAGETFELDGVRFKVLDADQQRIKRMSMETPGRKARPGAGGDRA